ncbi:major capsid protein [Nocardia sp. SYP-A9097]|uniref:major capsid protein n=1 Tax=Nocardia sp. SYP-A9097 TaxID=2663237 RepID=UPI00129A86E4|nr:major capsid protein [Nocardia sp. SYP-A9097]MRH86004.1 major capsid protein [Nocardia sp. SYP-A9097]
MKITLQSLIDAAAAAPEGQSPADAVAALLADAPSTIDAAVLLDEAIAKFGELRGEDGTTYSEDEVAALEALTEVATGVRIEVGRRQQAVSDQASRIADLAARVNPPADAGEGDGTTDGGESGGEGGTEGQGAEGATDTGAVVDTGAAAVAGENSGAAVASDAGAGAAPEPALVAAAPAPRRRAVRLSDIPAREVRRPDPAPAGVVITAAAELPGYAAGAQMADLAAVARAGTAKFDAFPSGHVPNVHVAASIAQFAVQFPEDLISRRASDDETVFDRAVDQSRLPKGSLVAAGGWCSPSERLYEMSPILADANAGLIDVPDVQSARGGLTWTEGPDYTAIYSGTGFIQTEAQALAGSGFTTAIGGTVTGTTKPIYRVPCPSSWPEQRAEAIGFGVAGGILQNDTYSELTEDVVAHSLIAHSHRVNARTISRMVADAGSAITLSLGSSATPQLLNSIDIQIEDIRYANRIGDGTPLEVVLPRWVKPVIRADQSIRTNSEQETAYTLEDAKINDWFAKRNAVVQWVYDWQDAFTGVSGGFGGASAITAWPTTVDALVYIAGSYLRSRGDVISMSAVYDTTNLAVNDVLHLFTEEKLLVIKRRYKPRLVRIALSANGTTAAGQILDANGKIVPAA